MSSRRKRRLERRHRHQAHVGSRRPPPQADELRETETVERLAYSRRQAAEALGVSISTIDRRVVPAVGTVKTPWGQRLIPVLELERSSRSTWRPVLRVPRLVPLDARRCFLPQSWFGSEGSTRPVRPSLASPGPSRHTAFRRRTAAASGGLRRPAASFIALPRKPGRRPARNMRVTSDQPRLIRWPLRGRQR
jgi:hypothetical protein